MPVTAGLALSPEILAASNKICHSRHAVNNKFVVLKMNDDNTQIVVDGKLDDLQDNAGRGDTNVFDHFLTKMPESDCRYAIYRFDFKVKSGMNAPMPKDKIVLISWMPETTAIHKKMIFASTKQPLKDYVQAVSNTYSAFSQPEIQREAFIQELSDMATVKSSGVIVNFEAMDV